MKGARPKVSVIIPTYNRAGLVGHTIQSVREQTFEGWELIVVDDASEDNTRDVICSIGDSKVKYVRHEVNRGGSAARNTGIENANGRYVLMIDDDDLIKKNHLRTLVSGAKRMGKNWGVFYTGFILDRGFKKNKIYPKWKGYIKEKLLTEGSIGTTAVALIEKKTLRRVGGFDENLPRHQDWDLYIRLAKKTKFYPLRSLTVIKRYTGKPSLEKVVRSKKYMREKFSDELRNLRFIKRRKFYSRESLRLAQLNFGEGNYFVGIVRVIVSLAQYPFHLKQLVGTLYNAFLVK